MKTDETVIKKEALKALRKERGETLAKAKSLLKVRSKMMREVKKCISGEAKTVPEMAEETGLAPSAVLWCVSALRKYGMAVEGEQDGDYFKYEAVVEKAADQKAAEKMAPEQEAAEETEAS